MTTGYNINASRPYGHSNKMARETSAELADISISAAAVRGATSSGGLATATMSGYASEGKKHVGIRAAHEEHQQAYLTSFVVACASTYFSMLSSRA